MDHLAQKSASMLFLYSIMTGKEVANKYMHYLFLKKGIPMQCTAERYQLALS
jgi:hypothetical protein